MTRDEAILIFMRTEGNSDGLGHGPTVDELIEANSVLDWFDVVDGVFKWKDEHRSVATLIEEEKGK